MRPVKGARVSFLVVFAHALHRPQITGEILKHVYEFEQTHELREMAEIFLHECGRMHHLNLTLAQYMSFHEWFERAKMAKRQE